MQHSAITQSVIGCAMRVHSTLGNGFQEVIYQRALALEMETEGLNFEREKFMSIYYRGKDIGTRRAESLWKRRNKSCIAQNVWLNLVKVLFFVKLVIKN
ncbi:MAG TPA: hypothetical protein DDW65_23520 [Firmicutes bacterium]|nr:hypothetical protein [Bacillota bacterium]